MAEDRNADETAEEKNSSPVSRRSFVKEAGAGAFGVSIIGFSGVSKASGTGIEVSERSDADAQETIKAARQTSEFKALRKHLHKEYRMRPVLDEAVTYEMTGERVNGGGAVEIVDIPVESQGAKQEQQQKRGEAIVERQASLAFGFQDGALAESKGTITDEYASGSLGVTTLSVNNEIVETEHVTRDPDAERSDRVTTQISKCGACREIVDFVCANACWLSAGAICAAVAFFTGPGATACAFIAKLVCDAYGDSVSRTCYRTTDTVCSDLGFC